jgi:hypothetical protein
LIFLALILAASLASIHGQYTAQGRLRVVCQRSFLARVVEVGVPAINLQDEEIEMEIEAARDLAR